jgi:hypothetical protein
MRMVVSSPSSMRFRMLSALSGKTLRTANISAPSSVQATCVEAAEGYEVVIANLTGEPQQVLLPSPTERIVILDAEHFVAVASDPLFADKMEAANGSPTIALGPMQSPA